MQYTLPTAAAAGGQPWLHTYAQGSFKGSEQQRRPAAAKTHEPGEEDPELVKGVLQNVNRALLGKNKTQKTSLRRKKQNF